MNSYPRELPPFPPLFDYPLFSPPIDINGQLIYDARHCAAFYLLQAYYGRPKAVAITSKLIGEVHPDIDATQLLRRCRQADRAAILQAIALISLALEYEFQRQVAEYYDIDKEED